MNPPTTGSNSALSWFQSATGAASSILGALKPNATATTPSAAKSTSIFSSPLVWIGGGLALVLVLVLVLRGGGK